MIFRRKSSGSEPGPEDPAAAESGLSESGLSEELRARMHGPWDRSETDVDAGDLTYVDLGGLVVRGMAELELRLQVDEQTSAVTAVMFAGPESGLELRAFAAPRHDGIWDDVRRDIATETTRRGGEVDEVDGEFGTELKLVVPVTLPDGRHAKQASRIVGVDGPRWLLRGTFLGKSAIEPDPDGVVERAFRDVIVVRGDGPMAPRETLQMQMPADAVEAIETDDGQGPSEAEDEDSEPEQV